MHSFTQFAVNMFLGALGTKKMTWFYNTYWELAIFRCLGWKNNLYNGQKMQKYPKHIVTDILDTIISHMVEV